MFQGYVGLPEGMGLSQSVQLLWPYEISPYTPKMTVKPVLNESFCEGINDILVFFNILVGGFKHFFIFHNIWDVILPIDSYSSRWLKPPTPNLCKSETKSQSPTITTYHNYGAMIMEGDPSLSLSASGSWHDCRHWDKNSRARNWSHLEKTSRV